MLNVINGFYRPQAARITFKGETARACGRRGGARRHRAHVPELALFRGMTTLDNIMAGRALKMHSSFFWQYSPSRSGA